MKYRRLEVRGCCLCRVTCIIQHCLLFRLVCNHAHEFCVQAIDSEHSYPLICQLSTADRLSYFGLVRLLLCWFGLPFTVPCSIKCSQDCMKSCKFTMTAT